MGKKGGGFNPFGGLFDFNRDGKTDFGEQWLAMNIFKECTKEDYETEAEYNETLHPAKYEWRETCDDGFEYGIEPDDYESEDEYYEALEEAKYVWRGTYDNGYNVEIDPEDYETEDEYTDALEETKTACRVNCDDDSEVSHDLDDFEMEEEYEESFAEAKDFPSASVTVPLSISYNLKHADQDVLDAVKGSHYPNKRKYDAAYHLCDVKQGTDRMIVMLQKKLQNVSSSLILMHLRPNISPYLMDSYLHRRSKKTFLSRLKYQMRTRKLSPILMICS